MSWETRKGQGAYYTRSTRKNGRIVRKYLGRSEVAQLIAWFEAEDRNDRDAAAAAWRAQKARDAALDQLIADVIALTETLATGALLNAGCYQHHRGWRRRGR
jgi:hypothetical protein